MFSTIVRRSHMYVALFLSPWLLMYALSTLVMNHREIFVAKYGRGPVPFKVERELAYAGSFAPDAAPKDIGRQILVSLDLDGAYGVNRRPDGTIIINRNDLVSPRRITYTPASQKLVVEKMEPRANAFLERFHRRRGFATGYALDTVWAVTVDALIAALVVWVLSGIWMWWEMKATRKFGAVAALGGVAVFAVFLVTI